MTAARFEVIGIGTNPDDGSPQRRRLVAAFDRFIDAHQSAPFVRRRAVARAGGGHAGGFERPHPGRQFRHSGASPGAGAGHLAGLCRHHRRAFHRLCRSPTRIVAPDARAFSEKIVALPDSFFPNDNSRAHRATAPAAPKRDCRRTAFVFCSFNNSWKLTEPVFAIWMRLLDAVPGSVLWLKQAGRKDQNQSAAGGGKTRASTPQRLIFAQARGAGRASRPPPAGRPVPGYPALQRPCHRL